MKIFLLSNMYPSKKDSLFGVFVRNFKENLERQGANFVGQVVIRGKTKNSLQKLLRYCLYYLRAFFFAGFVKSDFIYVHFLWHNTPLVLILHKLIRKKIVVNLHGSDIIEYNTTSFQKKINYLSLKCCERIVVPSLYFSEIIQKSFPSIDPINIIVYPSGGINRKVFQVEKANHDSESNVLRLGMTSRIDTDKGWDTYLYAIAALIARGYNVRGFIIGQGTEESKMLAVRSKLKLEEKISFLGLLSQAEIVSHYRDVDLFIFPTALNESLGLVGLEAMSCGLPVIASNVGAPSAYVVPGHNGYLFEMKNAEELSEKILAFYKCSEEDKIKFKKNAISTAMQYDSEKVSANLYHQLLQLC